MLTEAAVAAAFEAACLAELEALKPGNVHRHSPGHDMTVLDFELSARAAAPAMAVAGSPVGQRILDAVTATRAVAGQNTNLGIVLLCAPLAAAVETVAHPADFGTGLTGTLAALDIVDARLAYAAIRLANPGGLGRSAEADVAEEPRLTLLQSMAVAADRDRIAWNYANGFADILDLGIPRLAALSTRHAPPWATALLYLDFLAHAPDTHLLRKHGEAVAGEVQAMAERLQGRAPGLGLEADLLRLDADLKRRGLNPGTSADLTVATMFGCNLLAHLAHR